MTVLPMPWGTLSTVDEGGADTGGTVLLLHPLAQCGELWRPIIDELSPYARVLAPDARGHGSSEWDGSAFGVAELADDVATLIKECATVPVAVLGMSMGGCTAIELAGRYPELVGRLVLADTTACYGPGREQAWAQRADSAARTPRRQQTGFQVDRWFSPEFAAADPAEVHRVVELFVATDSAAHATACRALGAFDGTGLLGSIEAPTLVVVGEHDYATPPEMARSLHEGITGSRLVELGGTRHLSLLENRTVWPAVSGHLLGRAGGAR